MIVFDEEIMGLISELTDAELSRDSERLDQLYSDDFVGIGANGTSFSKPDFLKGIKESDGKFDIESVDRSDESFRTFGDIAIWTGHLTLHIRCNGQRFKTIGRMTWVASRSAGRWQIIHTHDSRCVEEKCAANPFFSSDAEHATYQRHWVKS